MIDYSGLSKALNKRQEEIDRIRRAEMLAVPFWKRALCVLLGHDPSDSSYGQPVVGWKTYRVCKVCNRCRRPLLQLVWFSADMMMDRSLEVDREEEWRILYGNGDEEESRHRADNDESRQ